MLIMEELREMDCSVLKRLLKREAMHHRSGKHLSSSSPGTCLLLDCRPFLAHSAGFIQGSVNVRCNTIVRRRAKGSVSLEQMLPAGSKDEEEVLSRLRSGLYSAIIVYDERSPRAESLREDSTVSLVVQALRKDTDSADICLLKEFVYIKNRNTVRRHSYHFSQLPSDKSQVSLGPVPQNESLSAGETRQEDDSNLFKNLTSAEGAIAIRAHRPSPRSLDLSDGGYERFHSEYPEFCAKSKSINSISLPAATSIDSAEMGCSSCTTPLHDQGGPVEILPFLYLGSAYHAARRDMLDALGITALLNVSSDCPNHFEGHFQYKCIPVEDNHKADISSWFMEAIEYIDSIKDNHGRVLVHCQAGISRSATICLAYLMMKKRVKLEEAFEFVKQRRSIISPNFSFMGQLLQFESQVLTTTCATEAASPSATLLERSKNSSSPTSPFVFSFPVSVAATSSLPYLHSPITTSPSC